MKVLRSILIILSISNLFYYSNVFAGPELTGEYEMIHFRDVFVREPPDDIAISPWSGLSQVLITTNDSATLQEIFNTSGSLDNRLYLSSTKPDGMFILEDFEKYYPGAVSFNPEFFTMAMGIAGIPEIGFGIKKTAKSYQPPLAGEFYMVKFADNVIDLGLPSQSTQPWVSFSRLTLYPDGSGEAYEIFCSNQSLSQELDNFSWSVDNYGRVTLTVTALGQPELIFQGTSNHSGDVFSFVRTDQVEPTIAVCIKKHNGLINHGLNGKYYVSYYADEGPPYSVSTFFEIILGGQGKAIMRELGLSSDPFDDDYFGKIEPFTYSVENDGRIIFYWPPDDDDEPPDLSTEYGVIMNEGDLFAIVSGDESYAEIAFGIKATLCLGDFDKDNDVDGSDLAVFAADFGRIDCETGLLCKGDFDMDGDMDGSDLAIFASDFGRTDCSVSP